MSIYGRNLMRHPPEIVMQAIDLHDNDWTPAQIVRILDKRGITVSISTVCRWIDPEQAERDRTRNRDAARRKREELRRQTPDDAFKGLTGLSRKVAELEARVQQLERAA